MTTLTKDGTLLIRNPSILANRQWALALPVYVMDEDIPYNITVHSSRSINEDNYSLLFVKYNSLLAIYKVEQNPHNNSRQTFNFLYI